MERVVLWLVLLSGSLAQEDMDKKVFLFPKATDTAHVILKPTLNKPLDKFTICLRSYNEMRSQSLISWATQGSERHNTVLILFNSLTSCSVFVNQEVNTFTINADSFEWKHICVTWDSHTGVIQLWVDGKVYPRRTSSKGFTISPQSSIILGQDQDSFGGGFDIKESFVGEITDVHIWDYVLPLTDINEVLFSYKSINGNIISWRSLQYEIKGDVLVQPRLQCKPPKSEYTLC
ncbi:C-reactive protein-like isoform 1-T3 [Discoglossus pictus]